MDSLYRFNSLASLEELSLGVGSTGLALLARDGFYTTGGFVITPEVCSDFLKKKDIDSAMAVFRMDRENMDAREGLKAAFFNERIPWGHEMDLISGFRELGGTASVVVTTRMGTDTSMFYASKEEEFLNTIKACWLRWLLSDVESPKGGELPAVLVRAVVDAETSMELRRSKGQIQVRAVFGLPEGLDDPAVSSDIYEFDAAGELARMEQRKQELHYVLGRHGPAKVAVAEDFQDEEKASGEMLKAVEGIMGALMETHKLAYCIVCFVGDRPVIYSAEAISESHDMDFTLPHREDSLSLMRTPKAVASMPDVAPVLATKLFLRIEQSEDLDAVKETYVEGLLFPNSFIGKDEKWPETLTKLAEEANRRLGTSRIALEITAQDIEKLFEFCTDKGNKLADASLVFSVVLPGTRTVEELKALVTSVKSHWEGLPVNYWVTIKYPSNLFFMDTIAEYGNMLALDLETFSKLMLGAVGGEEGRLNYSLPVLKDALSEMLMGAASLDRKVAVMSSDLVGSPTLLELLVREGVEILCLKPEEMQTVRHIVASIEKRMLLERK